MTSSNDFQQATVLMHQGRFLEAEKIFARLMKRQPNAGLGYWQGLALLQAGQAAEALPVVSRALRLARSSNDGFALQHLRGAIFFRLGQFADAAEAYGQAAVIKPDHVENRRNLSMASLEAGHFEACIEHIDCLQRLQQATAGDIYHQALAWQRLGAVDEALQAFEQCLLHPHLDRNILRQAAHTLILMDAMPLAVRAVEIGGTRFPAERVEWLHLRARLAASGGTNDPVLSLYAQLQEDPDATDEHRYLAAMERARLLFAQGHSAAAQPLFETGKGWATRLRRQAGLVEPSDDTEALRAVVLQPGYRRLAESRRESPSREHSPIFVVGFPRSGTTLMERLLDAHSRLFSLPELPTIDAVIRRLPTMGYRYPQDLPRLRPSDLDTLRATYFQEVRRHLRQPEGTRLVDKQPVNLIHLPLIHLLFPEAAIIRMTRDPLASCLSAVSQSFAITAELAHFRDAESTVKRFRAFESSWQVWRDHLRQPLLSVAYESLARDPEGELPKVMQFVGLDYEPSQLDYARRQRYKLDRTPSRQQLRGGLSRLGLTAGDSAAGGDLPLRQALKRLLQGD